MPLRSVWRDLPTWPYDSLKVSSSNKHRFNPVPQSWPPLSMNWSRYDRLARFWFYLDSSWLREIIATVAKKSYSIAIITGCSSSGQVGYEVHQWIISLRQRPLPLVLCSLNNILWFSSSSSSQIACFFRYPIGEYQLSQSHTMAA